MIDHEANARLYAAVDAADVRSACTHIVGPFVEDRMAVSIDGYVGCFGQRCGAASGQPPSAAESLRLTNLTPEK